MGEKERRKALRISIISGNIEYYRVGGTYEVGRLCNISQHGCFIARTIPIKPFSQLVLMFRLPGDLGILDVAADVQWVRWAKRKEDKMPLGFGASFNLPLHKQNIMDSFIQYMRNIQIFEVAKNLREELHKPPLPPT